LSGTFFTPYLKVIVFWRFLVCSVLTTLPVGLGPSAFGGTLWNSAVDGPLSTSGLAPTALGPMTLGSNDVFGTTGSSTTGVVDLNDFVVTVPTGFALASITELPGTQVGGSASFIGVEAGPQVTVSPDATTAAGLLGWTLYTPAEINTNILPSMAIPADGSSGFTTPLGPGQYSFWIQEGDTGTFAYGFDLGLVSTTSVPEPGTLTTSLIGLAVLVPVLLRRRRVA
jgi:hypothetical protein